MLDIITGIFFFITIPAAIVLVGGLVIMIPIFLRIYRIGKVADTFGLTYSSNFKWFRTSSPSKYERNILYGKVNEQTVRIYDLYDDEFKKDPLFYFDWATFYFGRRMTVLELNWQKPATPRFFLKQNVFGITGFASVRIIKKVLKEIADKGKDAEISSYSSTQARRVTTMMYLYVFLVVAILSSIIFSNFL